jgi:hypothetical protein
MHRDGDAWLAETHQIAVSHACVKLAQWPGRSAPAPDQTIVRATWSAPRRLCASAGRQSGWRAS